jgi:VIT1/CCC1 family predicted Fe2+/Mn2+ transporter
MMPRWRLQSIQLFFFIVTGFAEGILTALTLAAGRILAPGSESLTGLAVRVGLAAGFPEAVVFFAAEYSRQQGMLLRMERQLNLTERGRLASSRLGRQALEESLGAALVSALCAFGGATTPLLVAGLLPGPGWLTIAIAVLCLALLGAGIAHALSGCRICWSLGLALAGVAMAILGACLRVV